MTISKSKLINIISNYNKEVQYNIYCIIEKNSKESIETNPNTGEVKINFSKIPEKIIRQIDAYIKDVKKEIEDNQEYEKNREILLIESKKMLKEQSNEEEAPQKRDESINIISHIKEVHMKRFGHELKLKLNESTAFEDYNKFLKKECISYKSLVNKYLKKKNKTKTFNKMAKNSRENVDEYTGDDNIGDNEEHYDNIDLDMNEYDAGDEDDEEPDYEPDPEPEEEELELDPEEELDPDPDPELEEDPEPIEEISLLKSKLKTLFGDSSDSESE